MQSAVNYARGRVLVRICGPFPERVLNLFARQKVVFWSVVWQDEQTLSLMLLQKDLKKAQELSNRAGCTVQVETKEGVPAFVIRFRHRYAFLVGLTLSVLAVCFLSNFVLTVDVTGNESVPRAVILSQLRQLGLRPGVYGPGLDTKQIALDAQLALDDLSWMGINLCGTRAQVVVREVVRPPVLLEQEGVSDIQARAGGLILRTEVLEGQAKVKPGDTVAPGDVLISGTVEMEGPEYSEIPTRYIYVRAEGTVWARTWRTVQAAIPLTATVKEYTGEEITRRSLTVFDTRINFYGNGSISWGDYDKIYETHSAVLSGGQQLPISLCVQTLRRWQPCQVQINTNAAQSLLEEQLYKRLKDLVGKDGKVVSVDWSARIADGLLTVTGTAECEEQIGFAGPATG